MSIFQRFEPVGTTPHRHEREGIEWLQQALPNYEPFGGLALFSFATDDGRRYEVDAIALTAHCLYVIEMKAWQGDIIDGTARHLVTFSPERGRETVDHPLPLLETKTKSLMNRVRLVARRMRQPGVIQAVNDLWAEPLVWLTHAEDCKLGPHDAARSHVTVGRKEIAEALRHARFPGARDDLHTFSVSRETLKLLRRVLAEPEFGLRSIDKPLTVVDGRFDLADLVEEGDDYQDHWAVPHGIGPRRRVRSYLVPKSDHAFAAALERRVKREASVLTRLEDHPHILALEQFDPQAPLGPALVFRGFGGKALDAFLMQERTDDGQSRLDIDDKLTILRRVADALTYCHRKEVIHGALSPEAVLVQRLPPHRPDERGSFDVKLTRFALASAGEPASEGARLFTRLAGASASLYEAPEVARGMPPTESSDMFSLGALAYFLLAGEPPAHSTVELAQRLERDQALTISAVRDDLFPSGVRDSVDLLLLEATCVDPTERLRSLPTPLDFIDRLEEALTTPDATPEPVVEQPAKELDPLEATKHDKLGDLTVLGELGSGATARVFKISHPREGEVALKVPLSEAHDERIVAEARVLEKLRRFPGVDRIAHFIETREIAGRTCLILQLAGERTLADEIRSEGALSLDYAHRWGDDLLTAVRSLEEAGIQHRDIKPANMGLTSGADKGKKRLLLFDFSLSSKPATDLGMGTPAYKDPGLPQRGHWDDAADRWATAITLHEMFTGVRPAPLPTIGAKGLAVRIEADRIDADVRDGLVRFFEQAFKFQAGERYATAEDMRDAFTHALHEVPEERSKAADEPQLDLDMLKGLAADARVRDLPLSARKRNALDRMGIYTLHDLAQVSSNRLGGVRGVGAQTARFLVELADLVREHLEISASDPPVPFFQGFSGARCALEDEVESGRLSAPLGQCLLAAGLSDSLAIASAPQAQITNLLKLARKGGAKENAKDLTAWLDGLQHVLGDHPPATLAAAVALLAPETTSKGGKRVRQYLGLDDCVGFSRHGSMVELARASGITRAAVSIDVGKVRDRWLASPRAIAVLTRVFAVVEPMLAASARVVQLERAAAAVVEAFPREPDLSEDATRRAAEALVRAVTEVDAQHVGGPTHVRLVIRRAVRGAPPALLLAWDRFGFDLADVLGREADALVADGQVVAEPAAAARLREVLALTDLSPRTTELARVLSDRALVTLATLTAEHAKLSARGELYPAGLSAERALILSASALVGRIHCTEVERRVRARYPEGARLPEDPATLERLAKSLGLLYADGDFVPNERTLGLGSTEFASHSAGPLSIASPSVPATARLPLAERPKNDMIGATALRVFDEELERAAREGSFRVLLWRGDTSDGAHRGAPYAERVATAIARRLRGQMFALDGLLIQSAEEIVAAQEKMRRGLAPALEADARGPEGPMWGRLLDLMRLAGAKMLDGLWAVDRPRILTRLGLLGRYDLLSTLATLAQRHRDPSPPEGRACTLVVLPVFSNEGAVVEVGADVAERVGAAAGTRLVPVPGLLPHELMEVPSVWVTQKADKRPSSQPPVG